MAIVLPKAINADQVVYLRLSWDGYAGLVASLGDDSHARLTYDGETLEIMSPGSKHERLAEQIGELISALMAEWVINIVGTGSTTFQKPGASGVEADKSYYIQSAARVGDFDNIDLAIDPPPDLAIEIDITNIRDDKKASFAKIGVPEFWRYRRDRLEAFALVDGAYAAIGISRVIAGLPIDQIGKALNRRDTRLDIVMDWRAWLRANRHLHESA